MGIENVRIDERLIHGQVANMWTNYLKASRIMVVDDEAASSDMIKMSLKLATPAGVRLSVLTIEKATANILNGNYDSQNVFLLTKTPQVLEKLLSNNVKLKEINIGNMSKKEGTKALKKSVNLSSDDIQCFERMSNMGAELVVQMVPNEPKEMYFDLLNKLRKEND